MPKKNTDLVPMKENKLLVEVIIGGFMGGLAGIIVGLILGLIVWGIVYLGLHVEGVHANPTAAGMSLTGMTIGSVIGGVFGCIAGIKQEK